MQLVLTLIGTDQPGLVEAVARIVSEYGGNWQESRMARLAGKFAGILSVGVDAARADELIRALRALEQLDVHLVVERSAQAEAPATGPLLQLELMGPDRPGLVHEITAVLAERGVNLEELETERQSAPMSGEMMFRARALLRLPSGCTQEYLRAALHEAASDLTVDVVLREPDDEI